MTSSVLRARTGQDEVKIEDQARLRDAINAVCAELGLADDHAPRRALVEASMRDAFRRGPRHNLNLVDAGLRT